MMWLGIGYGEVLVIGFIALLLFGKRIPEACRILGRSMQKFLNPAHGHQVNRDYDPTQLRDDWISRTLLLAITVLLLGIAIGMWVYGR